MYKKTGLGPEHFKIMFRTRKDSAIDSLPAKIKKHNPNAKVRQILPPEEMEGYNGVHTAYEVALEDAAQTIAEGTALYKKLPFLGRREHRKN